MKRFCVVVKDGVTECFRLHGHEVATQEARAMFTHGSTIEVAPGVVVQRGDLRIQGWRLATLVGTDLTEDEANALEAAFQVSSA